MTIVDAITSEYGILGLFMMGIGKLFLDIGRLMRDEADRRRRDSIPPRAVACEQKVADLHELFNRADPMDPMRQPLIYRLFEKTTESVERMSEAVDLMRQELAQQKLDGARLADHMRAQREALSSIEQHLRGLEGISSIGLRRTDLAAGGE